MASTLRLRSMRTLLRTHRPKAPRTLCAAAYTGWATCQRRTVSSVGRLRSGCSSAVPQRRGLATLSGIDPDPFIRAGTLALQQGDPEEATRQFTLAVVANPAHPTGYCYRAECRVALGHYAEAIKDFQKATELAPQLPFVRRYLAECHAAIGDLAAADSEYKHAIELAGPLDTDVRLGYANMLLRVGQERRALAAYDEVLDILTGHGVQVQDAWLGKARAFSRLGNAGEAEEAFKSSLQEDEDGVDGMAGEAGAWRRRGAMEAHAALAALAMTDGRAHEAVLRYTEAVEATQQEIAACGSEGSPEGADELGYTVRTLRCHRAAALLAVADYDGALQDCDAVLRERVAANADALLVAFITRAQCRTALGEWGRATEDFTAYLDATRQADAESSLDPSPEAAARRRQRAQVLLKRSEALVGTALALPVSDANRSELQSLYTAALMDLEHCEATCTDLDMVAAAAEMRKSIRGDESDIVRKGR